MPARAGSATLVPAPDARSGRNVFLSPLGAKTLRNGQYPLHPDIEAACAESSFGKDLPFALEPIESRRETAQKLLRAAMGRVITSGANFRLEAA